MAPLAYRSQYAGLLPARRLLSQHFAPGFTREDDQLHLHRARIGFADKMDPSAYVPNSTCNRTDVNERNVSLSAGSSLFRYVYTPADIWPNTACHRLQPPGSRRNRIRRLRRWAGFPAAWLQRKVQPLRYSQPPGYAAQRNTCLPYQPPENRRLLRWRMPGTSSTHFSSRPKCTIKHPLFSRNGQTSSVYQGMQHPIALRHCQQLQPDRFSSCPDDRRPPRFTPIRRDRTRPLSRTPRPHRKVADQIH